MFEAIGHPVEELRRIAIGPLRDARLKVGHWRDLTAAEIAALKRAAAQESRSPQKTPGTQRKAPKTTAATHTRETSKKRPITTAASSERKSHRSGHMSKRPR
jgi:23S rRNA pseudouridine2605 synthase